MTGDEHTRVLADGNEIPVLGLGVWQIPHGPETVFEKGDVLLTMVHKGQHTELKSPEQFTKLLSGLDKSAVITLQVRRGESVAFVTISGLADKG